MLALNEQEEFEFRLRAEREANESPVPPESMEERSAKYGSINRTPTTIERVSKNLTAPETRPLGLLGPVGLGLSAFGTPEEDILPMAGQIAGTPSGFFGSTGGAMVGQTIKQLVQTLRGKKGNIKEVGKEGLITGLIEGLTRGTGKLFFRKQLANKTLETLGRELGEMKDAMRNNPAIQVNAPKLLQDLETAYSKAPEPLKRGQQSSVIEGWINHLKKNQKLSADDILSMEEDLGEVARFGKMKGGVHVSPDVKNPRMNRIAKGGRAAVSDIVDTVAEQTGQTGFKTKSSKIHKLLEKFPEFDPSRAYGSWGGRMGTAIGTTAVTGNPLMGALAYGAEKTLQSPGVRNALFRVVDDPVSKAIGTGTKLSLSELARKRNKK